jgi:hypothetical protein
MYAYFIELIMIILQMKYILSIEIIFHNFSKNYLF